MQRNNFKIKLTKSNDQLIDGIVYSGITEDDEVVYYFLEEKKALDAVSKLNIPGISAVKEESTYKITLTSAQFGTDSFEKIAAINELRGAINELNNDIAELKEDKKKEIEEKKKDLVSLFSEMEEKISHLPSHLMREVVIFRTPDSSDLIETVYSSQNFNVLKIIIEKIESDILCYSLFNSHTSINNCVFVGLLMQANLDKEEFESKKASEISDKCIEKLTPEAVGYLFRLRHEGDDRSCFSYLASYSTAKHFSRLIAKCVKSEVNEFLLSHVKKQRLIDLPEKLIPSCIDVMTPELIDQLFQVPHQELTEEREEKEPKANGFRFLACSTDIDLFIKLIDRATLSVIDRILLAYTKDGIIGLMAAASFDEKIFVKLIETASIEVINQAIITQSLIKGEQSNTLQYVLQRSSNFAATCLIKKASPAALKIALLQRNVKNESGFHFAVQTFSPESLSILLKKLRPEWIEDLLILLPTRTLQQKVNTVLSTIPESKEEKKPIRVEEKSVEKEPEEKSVIPEKSLDTLVLEIKELNKSYPDIDKSIDKIKTQIGSIKEIYLNSNSALCPMVDDKIKKPISEWKIEDCKKWASRVKNIPCHYDVLFLSTESKSELVREKNKIYIKLGTSGSIEYITSELTEFKRITLDELKISEPITKEKIDANKLTILEVLKNNGIIRTKKTEIINYLPEIIAVICRTVKLHAGYLPRDVQLFALLFLLQSHEKGLLSQIATGEGKSTIVAMLAMIKVLQGHSVDIVTSSPILAERDAVDKRLLFDALDLTVDHNGSNKYDREKVKPCYTADVVYGWICEFQWDILMHHHKDFGTLGTRTPDIVIADEVDSMMLDHFDTGGRLGSFKPGMQFLELLLIATWQELVRVERELHAKEREDWIEEKWTGLDRTVSEQWNRIKFILKEYLKKLIQSDESIIYIPKHLKEFALYQIDNWVRNAMRARYQFIKGRDYTITWSEEEKADAIAPVDYANTGIIQRRAVWCRGLHQFLEIKHNLKITSESMNTCYMSNHAYFKRYGSNIYGLTGTLGGEQTRALLKYIYSVDLVSMPTFRPKQFIEIPGFLARDSNEWLIALTSSVVAETRRQRATLIICECINDVDQIFDSLSLSLPDKKHKIKCYTDSDCTAGSAVEEVIDSEHIIIATNLAGRGTDIKTSKMVEKSGGLYVAVAFFPENKRVEDQAFGRTSRQGNRGTAQLFINKEITLSKYSSYCSDLKEVKTIEALKALREKDEIALAIKTREFRLRRLILFDDLLNRFRELTDRLRKINSSEARIDEIEDLWGFWVQKWEDTVDNDGVINEELILKDFARFSEEQIKSYTADESKMSTRSLLKGNESLGMVASIADYTRAIELDEVVSFQAYYNRAYSRIATRSGNYKADAISDLSNAKRILEERIIPQLQAMQIITNLNPEQKTSQSDLVKGVQLKIDLFQNQIKHIDNLIVSISHSSAELEIANCHPVNTIYHDIPQQDMYEFYQSGVSHFFEIQEETEDDEHARRRKRKRGLWGALCVAFLGILQIVAGIAISMLAPGVGTMIGSILISEGIGDMMFAARSMLEGNFSWDAYRASKATSIAVNIITMGIDSIKASSAVSTTAKAEFKTIARERIIKAIVTSGIKEVANYSLGQVTKKAIKHFQTDIEHHVRSTVMRYFSEPAIKIAIDKLLAADLKNKNLIFTMKLKRLIYDIVSSKQAVQKISTNILKGVLARQHGGIDAVIRLADIGGALEKILHFTRSVCEDFNESVKLLGTSLPHSDKDQTELRNKLIQFMIEMLTKVIMASLHRQVIYPVTDSVISHQVERLAESVQRTTRNEIIHREEKIKLHAKKDIFQIHQTKLSKSPSSIFHKEKSVVLQSVSVMPRDKDDHFISKIKIENRGELSHTRMGLMLETHPSRLIDKTILYRGAKRAPNEIFSTGFKARGDHKYFFKKNNAYIYTSLLIDVAKQYPKPTLGYRKPPIYTNYVYEICTRQPVIDASKEAAVFHSKGIKITNIINPIDYIDRLKRNKEMLIYKKVPSHQITGCWPIAHIRYSEFPDKFIAIPEGFIPNPNYIESQKYIKLWNVARVLGHVATGVSITWDGISLYNQYELSKETGNYTNTFRESSRIMGSWAGAWSVGSSLAQAGVVACSAIPYGSAVCGVAGGIIGSVVGYYGGGEGAVKLFDVSKDIPVHLFGEFDEEENFCTLSARQRIK